MSLNLFSLEGKVALITGGSRGIGKAVALAFAAAGADVVISSRRLPDLEEVAEEIRQKGRRSLAVAAHTGRAEDRERLIRRAKEEMGRIDILVNNAATNPYYGDVLGVDEGVWDKTMEVNLKGYFFMSQAAARVMIEQGGGCIINMASEAGLMPYPKLAVYDITKAGVIMMTKIMARELGKYNIRVNAIAPGWVQTRFSRAMWENPEELKEVLDHTVLGKLAQPEDIIGAALLLASDASRHITGETIVIDGGYSLM